MVFILTQSHEGRRGGGELTKAKGVLVQKGEDWDLLWQGKGHGRKKLVVGRVERGIERFIAERGTERNDMTENIMA